MITVIILCYYTPRHPQNNYVFKNKILLHNIGIYRYTDIHYKLIIILINV